MAALAGIRIAGRSRPRVLSLLGCPSRRLASTTPNPSSINAVMWGVGGGAALAVLLTAWKYRRDPFAGTSTMQNQKQVAYKQENKVHPEAEAEQLITPSSDTTSKEPSSPPTNTTTTTAGEAGTEEVHVDSRPEIPDFAPYVLVGAGTASFAAAKAIRECDPTAKVLIIGEEDYLPYSRPPLSKQLWLYEDHEATKKLKFKASWSGGKVVDVFYKAKFCSPKELPGKEEGGIAVVTGRKAVSLDPTTKKLTLDNGWELSYNKCLLATGGTPRNLRAFTLGSKELQSHISVYRAIPDYKQLDQLLEKVESLLIIGGSFLGSELAVGLASRGKEKGVKVSQVFPECGNLGLVLPKNLSLWTTDKVRKEGVEVHPNRSVKKATMQEGKVKVTADDGTEHVADHVVVAVGLEPNTLLSKSSKLEVDPQLGGYRVNSELQACTDVWVAGDVSCFYDPHLGRRRVEHHDHANVSGRLAGRNMAGANERFSHQSMFWSDVGPDVGFEATGVVDAKLPTIGVWARKPVETKKTTEKAVGKERKKVEEVGKSTGGGAEERSASEEDGDVPEDDYSKGIVFYMKEDNRKIVGVLTWNLFGKMDLAKEIIAKGMTETDIGEVTAKFEIH